MRALARIELSLSLTLAVALVVGCGDDANASAANGDGDAALSGNGDSDGDAAVSGGGDAAPSGDGDAAASSEGRADAGGDSGGDVDAGPSSVSISFAAKVGTEDFACDGVYAGLGTSDAMVEPLDFRFYVHDVQLLTGDVATPVELSDDDWQSGGVALLDFEDGSGTCKNGTPETRMHIMGTAPAGSYDGIAFKVGVPVDLNHKNPAEAPSPLNVTGLHWNWNGGYKFMRIDMKVLPDADTDAGMGAPGMPHNFHLGSTMCTGDAPVGDEVSCGHSNRPTVKLRGFDAKDDIVAIDYARLVAGEDMKADQGGKPGCMSFPGDGDCPALFDTLGLDYATGDSDDSQNVFSVE